MAGSGPSSSSSVYNSADEIDPMVAAADSADDVGGSGDSSEVAKEKDALVEAAPHERRRRLWRFRAAHPRLDDLGPAEPFHPTWTSRLLRYFSPGAAAAAGATAAQRRSARALSEAEALPAAPSLPEEPQALALNLNPLYEPVLRPAEADGAAVAAAAAAVAVENAAPDGAGAEAERYEEVGVACCLPCRRRKLPRSTRKLSSVELRSALRTNALRSPRLRAPVRREAVVAVRGSPVEVRLVLRPHNPPPLPPPRAPGHPLPSTPGAAPAPAAAAVSSRAGGSLNSVHSQIDYQHHFIPDLEAIYSSPYYWGVMDRFEAGEVLSNKPAGSFLLRDSAQNNFLFSISFRGYGRTLHARVDVNQHHFSLDCCDPQVAKSATVMGLMAVYQHRDGIPSETLATAQLLEAGLPLPENVVHPISIYEPTLKQPVFRSSPFSLQDIARATLCSHFSYDQVQRMRIPCHLRGYTNYYHYKHPVRVREVPAGES